MKLDRGADDEQLLCSMTQGTGKNCLKNSKIQYRKEIPHTPSIVEVLS